jgi:hypothetical protein
MEDWRPEGRLRSSLNLSELRDWRELVELADVSGVAIYRAKVTLGPGWNGGVVATRLDLGRVEGSVQVRVNGHLVSAQCVAIPPVDVQPYLLDGTNNVEIEVATTLNNRLVALGNAGEPGYRRFAARSQHHAASSDRCG